ncbi:MAG: ATPase [Aerococcus sp.]|nr:ATPase [Aerococcus sp.]
MITKMSVVNIIGPKDDIDRMADKYLRHYEFHPVNTLKELSGVETLKPYTSPNPYEPYEDKIDDLLSVLEEDVSSQDAVDESTTFDQIKRLVDGTEQRLATELDELNRVNTRLDEAKEKYQMYEPFSGIDYPLERILKMKRIKFRFGRFTTENFYKFKKYINADVPCIFVPSKEEDDYIYGVYFTPEDMRQQIDALFYSLSWERIRIENDTGTLREITTRQSSTIKELIKHHEMIENYLSQSIHPLTKQLSQAKARLKELSQAWQIRKYAAITRNEFEKKETRYLIIGWMATNDALALADDVKDDKDVTLVIEDDKDNRHLKPPTKLKNNVLFRPFEMITEMYGSPNYNEWDPTALVALTYSILFGAMFGDFGHGVLLLMLGILGYLIPKLKLAKLFVPVGLSSMIFGLLYGSIFGFETIIPAIWLRPAEHMTNIPFFGTLNTVFIVSVVFGMFLLLASMFINVCERLKQGDTFEAIFNKNGLMGMIFYGGIVFLAIFYMARRPIPGTIIFLVLIVLSFLAVAFNEQIMRFIDRHKTKTENEDGIGMQLVTVFFESFENLLTYFSNTISFVRVGAFAISHGIIMNVVLMFANVESGSPNWLVLILGNLFVVGFEGLVVFIQVLRLEYYELFSHFFQGDGISFKSIWADSKQ